MDTTTLSSKGQIIVPKHIREAHAWQAGLEFYVVDTGDGILLKPKRPFPTTSLNDVAGCLPFEGTPRTLEDMEAAIEQGVAEAWHDSR